MILLSSSPVDMPGSVPSSIMSPVNKEGKQVQVRQVAFDILDCEAQEGKR
jgi:hypothetical protein